MWEMPICPKLVCHSFATVECRCRIGRLIGIRRGFSLDHRMIKKINDGDESLKKRAQARSNEAYGGARFRSLLDVFYPIGHMRLCQLAGQPLASYPKGEVRGKSGLHGNTAPYNLRRGCIFIGCAFRESAAEKSPPDRYQVRVKGWSKSPPRFWQQRRHGKPRREQDRIGITRISRFMPERTRCRAVSSPVVRVGCVSALATAHQDEWLPRAALDPRHTEPGLQAN